MVAEAQTMDLTKIDDERWIVLDIECFDDRRRGTGVSYRKRIQSICKQRQADEDTVERLEFA